MHVKISINGVYLNIRTTAVEFSLPQQILFKALHFVQIFYTNFARIA